jgi:hypothetical protein
VTAAVLRKLTDATITMPQASHPRQCEASRRKNSAYESPLVPHSNRIKKRNLSERSEFVSLPDLSAAPTGTPKGRRIVALEQCSNPFFAYFLWRSKESKRLPGRTRQGLTEEKTESATGNGKSEQNTLYGRPKPPPK